MLEVPECLRQIVLVSAMLAIVMSPGLDLQAPLGPKSIGAVLISIE
jgi:hypothetical protein